MQPLYNVISMTGVVFIIWLGGRNIAGTGWTAWNIAVHGLFVLLQNGRKILQGGEAFNSVQKARVSWKDKAALKDTGGAGRTMRSFPRQWTGGGEPLLRISRR